MGRAEELRDDLLRDGVAGVEALVGQSESLHVECKSQLERGEATLAHFAKAASAFLNTEGGVILWGVRAPSPRGGRDDSIRSVTGVPNVDGCVTWLRSKTSGVVFPTASGIEHYPLAPSDRAPGCVLTYVPMSSTPPHRASHGPTDYFLRTPSSSVAMPHGVLAAMFGRRPSPRVCALLSLFELDLGNPGAPCLRLLVSIRNSGAVPARAPYLTLKDGCSAPGAMVLFEQYSASSGYFLFRNHRQHRSSDLDASCTAGEGVLVAPGDAIAACLVHVPIQARQGAVELSGVAGAMECPPVPWRLRIPVAQVAAAVPRIDRRKHSGPDVEWVLGPVFTSDTLQGADYRHVLAAG